MRLFVAAELPDELLDALAETSARLREAVRGRYVGSDLFHVTLAFLGEVPASRVPAVQNAVQAACAGIDAFVVALGDAGSFGKPAKAALWQGFDDPGALPDAARAVRRELEAAGFQVDGKKFVPHVTLMRNADLSAGALPPVFRARGMIDAVTLFESDLSGDRPAYEPLYRVRLLQR